MSFKEQKEFLSSIHPFDELSSSELERLIKGIDIAFFQKDATLIEAKSSPEALFVIIKGEISSIDEDNKRVMLYHQKDSFDADALISGKSIYKYVACEDTIVYEIEKKIFLEAFEGNRAFREFYTMCIVDRLEYLKQKELSKERGFFLTAKVSDSYIHKTSIVDDKMSLKDALDYSIKLNRSEIIVKSSKGYGVVTDSDIKRLLGKEELDLEKEVGEYVNYPLDGVSKDDFLFNAYLKLLEKNIKRLGVFDEGRLIGVIEQIDILSFFANKSHLLTLKIDKAESIEELKAVSDEYIDTIKRLYSQGVKSRHIAKLISEINRKLLKRVFDLIVPQEYRDSCAFIVMGSEGRREQIIKTDQDNALIVSDSVDVEIFSPFMERIGEVLIELGYPPCDGNIMVTNPFWRDNQFGYKKKIDRWLNSLDESYFIEFATFFDASVVAGDKRLLDELKSYIFERFDSQNSLYLAYFAKLTLNFDTPVGLLSSIFGRDKLIDIKKAGVFPIVQGTRALALKYKINQNSTVNRLKELSKVGAVEVGFAKEVVEAFEVLSNLRLMAQLNAIEQESKPTNSIDTTTLSKIKRDLLKDVLLIVDRFKKFISREFELEYLLQ